MADQLLSQADVDALVASLNKSEPAKPAAKPAAAPFSAPAPKPAVAAPVPAPAPAPKVIPIVAKPAPAPVQAAKAVPAQAPAVVRPAPAVLSTTKPEPLNTNFKTSSFPASRANEAAIPKVMESARPETKTPSKQAARPEPKPEVSMEVVNGLNAKIAELTKQLNQIQGAIKGLDGIEKKLGALTVKVENNREPAQTAERVQKLNEELKKIAHNLKGTPGYGIKHSFDCEKCSDHGHVAVMFRCTKCGQERWYGWWPEK